jgi:hypothetical protein
MAATGSNKSGAESSDSDIELLQKVFKMDSFEALTKPNKTLMATLIVLICVFILTIGVGIFAVNRIIKDMYKEYVHNTEEIIKAKSDIELSNSWERLPDSQRRERLKTQYYEIVRYYTNNLPPQQKMSDEQIQASFNTLWSCTTRIPSINFFLPIAYMKVATNFNPIFDVEWKRGIASFYTNMGSQIANLPLVRNDIVFQTVFKGSETLNNPSDAIKLLVARIDDLMTTFNGRTDWILLSLFANEYEVIAKYWKGGSGVIPDSLYRSGQLADALMYYQSFKNWQIPAVVSK